ncbi:hypothetical protein [Bacteroides thetaiotaomicron]|uniref:hypothetical protein n=1 Tax=Bacteroides thetaiotaomicron TaxID=818 RepID=UPI0039C455D6
MEDTTVDLFCDNDKFCQYAGEFISRIRNSVENNVTLQKDEIKRMLETIDITKFNLKGETVEDRIQSFNARYISKVREKLAILPRRLYTNSSDVATITPEYLIDKNNNIIPDPNAIVSFAEHINENELLKNTEINTVTLEDSDIKLNAEEQTFTVRVNGNDYVFGFEENEAILKDIRPLPQDENPQIKFVDEFSKEVQSLINSLSKDADITKMTKIKLKIYNIGRAVAKVMSTLDINAIAEELSNPDTFVFEVVDKYLPTDIDNMAKEGTINKIQAIRDSLNNEGNFKMKFVKEFKKKVRFLISNLSKDKDITKLSKVQSVLYIRGKAIVEILSTLDIDTIADDLFDTNVSVSEVIEKYVPREVDFKVIQGVESKLYALRNSLFNEFGI